MAESGRTPVAEPPVVRERTKAEYDSTSNGAQGLGPERVVNVDEDLEEGNVPAKKPVEVDNNFICRNMEWWQAGMLMIAETISLGILSLPSVLAAIGIVPGVILIIGLSILATYTGFLIGQFKLQHPGVLNMADAGRVMFGRIGEEVFGFAQFTFLIFVMASHVLTFSIMVNTLIDDGKWRCTIIFGLLGALLCFICTIPRQMVSVSHMSIVSFISIFTAVIITMVGVGTERPGNGHIDLTVHTSFYRGFLGVTNIIFAYAGHVTFFTFISELKKPEEYIKAIYLLQAIDTTMYVLVALVIYIYAGTNVASPALGSTGPFLRKIAYGTAIPTIIVSGVINGHVAVKYIHTRMFLRKDGLKLTFLSKSMWLVLGFLLWTLAWVIAEAIPVFNDLLGLISALFASWFTYGISGVFWLFLNRGHYRDNKTQKFLTGLNVLIFIIGGLICGLGTYSSMRSIVSGLGSSTGVFSCADNSRVSAG